MARRKPLKSKRPAAAKAAKSTPKKLKAPGKRLAPDEPRVAMGRMPKVGVESHACSSEQDRIDHVAKLRREGLRRLDPLERLSAGTYDVRSTPDGAVILSMPKAEEG